MEHLWTAPIDGAITDLKIKDGKIIATIGNVEFIVDDQSNPERKE